MTGPEQARADATLTVGGTAIELPVEQPTLGRTALDVSSLAQYGLSVFDPGYADTAAYHSAITFVDGEAGRLYYRGYPVEQLATNFSFLEVAYLLIYGELPTAEQADQFIASVRDPKLVLHVGLERLFDSFPQSMHPMAMLAIATEALSAYAGDAGGSGRREEVEQAGISLLSAMPIFAGYALSTLRGMPRAKSNRSLDYAEDLLQLCFTMPGSDYLPDNVTARALDTLLVLHADHELNCSTATLRMVASSGAGFLCRRARGYKCPLGTAARGRGRGGHKNAQGNKGFRPAPVLLRRKGQGPQRPVPADGVWAPGVQDDRCQGESDPPGGVGPGGKAGPPRPPAGHRPAPGRSRPGRRFLHFQAALPERRFLLGHRLHGDRFPRRDVHSAIRGWAHGRVGGALAGNDEVRRQPHR